MKNNNLEQLQDINYINNVKSKYFFIGFITALIPYIFISILFNFIYSINLYRFTIIIIALVTAIINGFILTSKATKILQTEFINKYK